MSTKSYCFLALFLAFSHTSFAQQALYGKIVTEGSSETITGANIFNINQGKRNTSDQGGNYKIMALAGDTIIFSSAGYLPDTLIVAAYMFTKDQRIMLAPNVTQLQTVVVTEGRDYHADSIDRRNDYGFILDKKHPVKLMNEKRPGDAPGFNFSPVGFFSKGEKQKRRLKARLAQQEEDYYIDYKFPATQVSKLTGLRGDSLRLFMNRYRPSYSFCRKAGDQDILQYVNEKFKLFKKSQ
jgi:hypothetical protein